MSWVQFSARAHASVMGSVPLRGVYEEQQIEVSFPLSAHLPLSLKAMKRMSSGEDT